MNVFGFNDDLNLDDRLVIQNATDNQLYNLVERPKYLLSFDLKDSEKEFLYTISKQEARKTTIYLAQLILLNKIVIAGDIMQNGQFEATIQFYCMFPIFVLELVLIYKLNNPQQEQIFLWTYVLLVYGILVLGILLSYQAKYLGQWTVAGFNELQIQLTLSLIFMMRKVLLRHYCITYIIYMFTWIIVVTFVAERFEYQIIQFLLGQIMYAVLLAVGIHHREMLQRKSLNYDRILSIEIQKTNVLISRLVPFHILSVIRNEKRQVDEFEDLTLLHTDFVGFNTMTRKFEDQRDTINLLNKVFTRFDQLCEEHRVYKVHTIGNQFVLMGYNGRPEKDRRTKEAVIGEASRVLQVGFDMLEYVEELGVELRAKHSGEIKIRIGIHTGRVVAGIIGSKIVRYDVLGEGVLITKKLQANGALDSVCISEDTKNLLLQAPDTAAEYYFD